MARVSSVMTSRPAACSVETSIAAVAQLMMENDCGEIPVVDGDGHPVGVITDRDIVVRLVAAGRDTANSRASDAMSQPVRTVEEGDELGDCVSLMEKARIRRVPVVDGDGRLTGMVSLADIALAGKDKATAQVVKQVSQPNGAVPLV